MPRVLRTVAALATVVVVLASGVVSAGACTIDGVPTISANGHLAVKNGNVPQNANFLTWSPFVIKQRFHPHQTVRLAENRAQLKAVLAPEGLRGRWRWAFGDGTTSVGRATATHGYARPGRFRVTVSAYFAAYKAWVPFDTVQVTVS